jgi:hypothetical protein
MKAGKLWSQIFVLAVPSLFASSTPISTALAQSKAPIPTAPVPTGGRQSFRPDFRGTVEYSGSYAGQTASARAIDGDFSISLEIFEDGEIRGKYKSTGQFGSGRIWGKRYGDRCILQQSNLIWKAHCGPDGFFASIESGNGTTSPLQISINGANVSYPSAVDQGGMQPKPKGPTPLEALVNDMSKQAAEDRLITKQFRIRNNQLATQAIANKTNVSACLDVETRYTTHTEFGPVHDGLFAVNRNHSVKDYYEAVVNSCAFVIDVKIEGGFRAIAANGTLPKHGNMDIRTAKPHIFSSEELQ